MNVRDGLIRILADGERHSGNVLAATLGVSRSAVWKQAHRLGELGLEPHADSSGYRLAAPVELLERQRIIAGLGPEARAACERLDVEQVLESTSTALARAPPPAAGRWCGALAEYQSGGRGRRGRRWVSPFGSGLCLSLSWTFAVAPRELPALSLAAAVGVSRALASAGAKDVTLKWPNDVLHAGAKLAGILVDVDGDSRGPLRAVIGVGLNVTVPAVLATAVAAEGGLPVAGLDRAGTGGRVSRNALAAGLLTALHDVLREFADSGFAPFADEWRSRDFLLGRQVVVRQDGDLTTGVVRGIAADGALLVQRPGGMTCVFSGDVTLRAGP
jgi:BirA family biotin operon repressor/biotin-[acetyl-CoA-carboxylase] ligase